MDYYRRVKILTSYGLRCEIPGELTQFNSNFHQVKGLEATQTKERIKSLFYFVRLLGSGSSMENNLSPTILPSRILNFIKTSKYGLRSPSRAMTTTVHWYYDLVLSRETKATAVRYVEHFKVYSHSDESSLVIRFKSCNI